MTPEQEIALLANVKSITDHMTMVDEVFKQARLGRNMELVFVCSMSGLFYPADYAKEWGRGYGDGLGPDVCSESLQSDYHIAPPEPDRYTKSLEQIMHPLRSSRAQMDALLVDVESIGGNRAVLEVDDPNMDLRAPILRAKQMKNPQSKIARLDGMALSEAKWFIQKEGGWR